MQLACESDHISADIRCQWWDDTVWSELVRYVQERHLVYPFGELVLDKVTLGLFDYSGCKVFYASGFLVLAV